MNKGPFKKPGQAKGGWRYQAVIVTDPGGTISCGICELYFDENDRLKHWTTDPFMYPAGFTVEELKFDLIRMLMDSYSWVPVNFEDLKVGMTFERALTQAERDDIADMIQTVGMAAKPRVQ